MTRRFFQIHLLTAFLATFVVAGFLWANMRVRDVQVVEMKWEQDFQVYQYQYMGWPALASDAGFASGLPEMIYSRSTYGRKPDYREKRFHITGTAQIRGRTVVAYDDLKRTIPDVDKWVQWRVQESPPLPTWSANFYWKGIAINAVVALAATLAMMFGLEWFLRRRERGKI